MAPPDTQRGGGDEARPLGLLRSRLQVPGLPLHALQAFAQSCRADLISASTALVAALQRRHGGSGPVSLQVKPGAAGSGLLQRVGPEHRVIEANTPLEAPFRRWVEEMEEARSLDGRSAPHPASTDSSPSIEDGPWLAAFGCSMPIRPRPTAPAEWWLWVRLELGEEGLHLVLEAETSEEMLASVAGRLRQLLESVLAAPERPMSLQPLLTAAEQAVLLEAFNASQTPFPPDITIPELFAAQVARTPDAVALVDQGRAVTFRELDQRSNQLAHYLRDTCGVRPGDIVVVMMDGSEWLVIGLLGILKAGAAYLPVDPSYPEGRIAHILRESAAKVYLVRGVPVRGEMRASGAVLVEVDQRRDEIERHSRLEPRRLHSTDEIAYVIYTSGSTGRPKGILQTHRCLANFLQWQVTASGLERGKRVLQFASPSFDVSVQELLFSLLSGGCLFLISDEQRHDLRQIARLITDEAIEIVDFPFSVISLLFGPERLLPSAPSLRHLISAGEPLQITSELEALLDAQPDLTIHNHYGPSETHMLTTHSLSRRLGNVEPLPPLGKPISNMRAYVLDAARQLVPIGVVGEIYIGGPGLARGYIDAAMTAERFLPHPFRPHERIYKSGDLGRWREDGTLEILGRIDHQVKVRGFRIELGDIEAALRLHPKVSHAAVIVRQTENRQRELVAFYSGQEEADRQELRKHLETLLPAYMHPARFIRLDTLPLSPNGKVDRAALGALATKLARPVDPVEEPGDSLEQRLIALWSEILEQPVQADDDLFSLGADSLKIMLALSRMSKQLGLELGLRELFLHSTVASQAELARTRAPASASLPPILPRPAQPHPPVSEGQRSLWIFDQLAGEERVTYNFTDAFWFKGPLDPVAVRAALAAVQERHEILRTTFAMREGELRQQLHFRLEAPFSELKLGEQRDLEAEIHRLARAETRVPFDLASGPLMRAKLLRLSSGEGVLLVSMHHILSDAWSTAVLERDLGLAYEALREGRQPAWQPLPIQYRDFAAWQNELAASEAGERSRQFWRDRLSGPLPCTYLPPDRPLGAERTYRGESFRVRVPDPLAAALRGLDRPAGSTLFRWLLGGFAATLFRRTGASELVLGSTMACRQLRHLEDQVGLYVNLVPLRIRIQEGDSYAALVTRLMEDALEAHEHQFYPFTRLLEAVAPPVLPGHAPLFDIGFQMVQTPPRRQDAPVIRALSEWAQNSRNHLWFTAAEEGPELSFILEYNTDLYDRTTIERLFADYLEELKLLSADPERLIRTRSPDARAASAALRSFAFDFSE